MVIVVERKMTMKKVMNVVVDGEAGWWTTCGNIGLPPLARVMGVGRQQQRGRGEGVVFCDGECGEDGAIRCKTCDDGWAGKNSVDSEDTFSFISLRIEGLTSETVDNSYSNGVGDTSSLLE